MDNIATKVRILYSDTNIDSVLATTIMVSSIRESWILAKSKDTSIDLVSYNGIYHEPSNEVVDLLITIGVHVDSDDLMAELRNCTPATVLQFDYRANEYGSDVREFTQQLKQLSAFEHLEHTPMPVVASDELLDVEEVSEASMSVLVAEYLKNSNSSMAWKSEDVARLITATTHYMNFNRFNQYFDFKCGTDDHTMSMEDLAFFYYCIPTIREAEANKSILVIDSKHFKNNAKSKEFLQQKIMNSAGLARKIISRSMTKFVYHYKSKQLTLATVNVGEENAIEVMRQMALSFNKAITYEDMRGYRVWRIYCASIDKPAMDFLRGLLEPRSEYVVGKMRYFITDVPQYDQKLNAT